MASLHSPTIAAAIQMARLDVPLDQLSIVSRSHRFFTYLHRGSGTQHSVVVVDFAPECLPIWPSSLKSCAWSLFQRAVSFLRPSAVNRNPGACPLRTASLLIDRESAFSMHPTQPYLAYTDKANLRVKDIYSITSVSGPEISRHTIKLPYSLAWTNDDTIEYLDPEGRVRQWNFRAPKRHAAAEVTIPSASAKHAVADNNSTSVNAVSPDSNWVLVRSLDPSPERLPLTVYDRSVRAAYPLVLSYLELQYATFLLAEGTVHLARVTEGPEPHVFQLHTYFLCAGSPVMQKKHPFLMTPTSENPQIVEIQGFQDCGLLVVTFKTETQVFALVGLDDIRQIYPRHIDTTEEVMRNVARRLLGECERTVVGGARVLRRQLLSLCGHQAIAIADILQWTLDVTPESDSIRGDLVELLQDISSASGQIPSSHWIQGSVEIGRFIRNSGDSIVSRGSHRIQGDTRTVAVRQLSVLDRNEWETPRGQDILAIIRREIVAQKQLEHKNVIRLLGIWKDQYYPAYLVTPLYAQPALAHLTISPHLFYSVVCDATAGLAYLHSRHPPIIHGDIHPGSIFIGNQGEAILCDLGLGCLRDEMLRTRNNKPAFTNQRYIAPELLCSKAGKPQPLPTRSSDIYSLSMTFYHLRTFRPPFVDLADEDVSVVALAKARPGKSDWPGSDSFWTLLSSMWDHRAQRRPDVVKVQETFFRIGMDC